MRITIKNLPFIQLGKQCHSFRVVVVEYGPLNIRELEVISYNMEISFMMNSFPMTMEKDLPPQTGQQTRSVSWI